MRPRLFPTLLRPLFLTSLVSALAIAACRTTFPTSSQHDFAVEGRTPDLVHGARLTMAACGGCHANPQTGLLTGKRMEDLPRALGTVYTANLTTSRSHSPVPAYSDGELAYLLRTGVTHDGRFLPYMLRPNLSDADMQDIIAFLRSGEGIAKATDTIAGKTRLSVPGKLGMAAMAQPLPYRANVAEPRTQIETGRYLVDNIGCFHCHSKSLMNVNYAEPEKSKGYLAGGARFKNKEGIVRGANITSDSTTGIGFYTREEFRAAIQHRIARGGRTMAPPTESFALTNDECDAIYAYIRSLPPKRHRVKGQVQGKG